MNKPSLKPLFAPRQARRGASGGDISKQKNARGAPGRQIGRGPDQANPLPRSSAPTPGIRPRKAV